MLTETIIVFSVRLGLMIVISILGGSVLPMENFSDVVEMDESDAPAGGNGVSVKEAAPAPPPPPAAERPPPAPVEPPASGDGAPGASGGMAAGASTSPEAPAGAASSMSAREMQQLAMSLAALPTEEERQKVMAPMSPDVREMLVAMMRGMDGGNPGAEGVRAGRALPAKSASGTDQQQRIEPFDGGVYAAF